MKSTVCIVRIKRIKFVRKEVKYLLNKKWRTIKVLIWILSRMSIYLSFYLNNFWSFWSEYFKCLDLNTFLLVRKPRKCRKFWKSSFSRKWRCSRKSSCSRFDVYTFFYFHVIHFIFLNWIFLQFRSEYFIFFRRSRKYSSWRKRNGQQWRFYFSVLINNWSEYFYNLA